MHSYSAMCVTNSDDNGHLEVLGVYARLVRQRFTMLLNIDALGVQFNSQGVLIPGGIYITVLYDRILVEIVAILIFEHV